MPSSSRRELQGPRPPPLKVSRDSCRVKKPATAAALSRGEREHEHEHEHREPVVVYLHTPKVFHTRPQDFMSLVQRLTGKSSSSSSSRCRTGSDLDQRGAGMDSLNDTGVGQNVGAGEGGDPLLLTLGQFSSMSSVPSPIISPSLFFCSPNTQACLQDLSPLF
ncbi:unnamed protein product [Musa acuminata subsp. burmannicoides]